MKLLIFIINRNAGNGSVSKIWDGLKSKLDADQINYRTFYTKYPRHAVELAKQVGMMYGEKVNAVIAVGGDGTIHEVMNGLIDFPNIPVGYIPAGSGNDFSRGFLLPKTPKDGLSLILEKIQSGRLNRQRFDVGKFKIKGKSQPQYFINNLGAGFDAEVAKFTNESKLKQILNKFGLGSLGYAIAVIRLLFTYRVTNLTLKVDGVKYEYDNVWFVTISNQPYYGGGMKIAPHAITTDGRFDVTIVHNLSKIKLLLLFVIVFFGKHTGLKEVAQHKGVIISVDSDEPLQLHADGELLGKIPVQVEVLYQKANIIVDDKIN